MTDLSRSDGSRSDAVDSALAACYQQLHLRMDASLAAVDEAYFHLRAERIQAGDRKGITPLKAAREKIKHHLETTGQNNDKKTDTIPASTQPSASPLSPASASNGTSNSNGTTEHHLANPFAELIEAFARHQLTAQINLRESTLNVGIADNQTMTPSQVTAMVKQVLSETSATDRAADRTLNPVQTIRLYGLDANNKPRWRKTFPRPQQQITADELDLGSFRNRISNTLIFPGLLLIGALLNVLEPIRLMLFGVDIWIHEFGHATVAWLGGYKATPLPFGWTNIEPDKSLFVYFGVLTLLGLLFWSGLKEKRRGPMVLAVGLAIAQFVMTWTISEDTLDMLLSFGGIGGEFYLSTLLIVGFYFPLPERWHWEMYRYPVVMLASFTFLGSLWQWKQIERGVADIPWGSLFGGADHIGGDMNQLHIVYGWSDQRIIDVYTGIGGLCAIAILSIYLYFFLKQRSHIWLYRWWIGRTNAL